MLYQITFGDSPAIIARRFGIWPSSLLAANPHKPTTVVAGRPTWRDLRVGEVVHIPVAGGSVGAPPSSHARLDLLAMSVADRAARGWRLVEGGTLVNRHGIHADRWGRPIGHGVPRPRSGRPRHVQPHAVHGVGDGTLGDAASDAINALMVAGDPCDPANVSLVCAAQAAMGLGQDGKWGSGTAAAAQAIVAGAPPGCSPRPSWWAPAGQVNCAASAPAPASPLDSAGVAVAAGAALAALSTDPNYCSSVGQSGTPVNVAVHNFKTTWNAANPGNTVPVGTGKYEPSVATALSSALGGQTVPPGCSGAAPAPAVIPSIPIPSLPAVVPAALQSILSANPCDPANAALVCAAQAMLGVTQDGKWGNDTATAARRIAPSAPPGCSPRPSWWRPTGQSNCGGALPAPPPIPKILPPSIIPPSIPIPSPVGPGPVAPPPSPLPPPPAPSAGPPAPSLPPPPVPGTPTAPSGGGGGGTVVVAPTTKAGISTGALIAGAIGALALVGVVAAASMSGKGEAGHAGRRGARGARGKAAPRHHKKTTHRKPHKRAGSHKKKRR